jgi:predicted kinase
MSRAGRRPEAVLLIGLPGSGKSTFYARQYARTHLRINLDMLRTRRREAVLVRACLATGQSFVVDNTNVTVEDRARFIAPSREAGFAITGCWFEPDLQGCLRRNRLRAAGRVPDAAIRSALSRLRPPSRAEGFDRLVRVSAIEPDDFRITPWDEPA